MVVAVTQVEARTDGVLAISGRVISASWRDELPAVNVQVRGEGRGTRTDENGVFTLDSLVASQTLNFSYVGFERLEVRVDSLLARRETRPRSP